MQKNKSKYSISSMIFSCLFKKADQDDWKKLVRVIEYLNNTENLVLTLSARKNGINLLERHVGGAYQVHHDHRSPTGIVQTIGKGGVCNSSVKHKISMRNRTELN